MTVNVKITESMIKKAVKNSKVLAERMFKEHENHINEILAERICQDLRWGEQLHPSVDPILTNREGGCTPERMCERYGVPSPNMAQQATDIHADRGNVTFADITVEEMSEAIGAKDDKERREELIQLAACVLNWIRAIDKKLKEEQNNG